MFDDVGKVVKARKSPSKTQALHYVSAAAGAAEV
jgi:hypothetical protein